MKQFNPSNSPSKQHGFTLIEVLVASFILFLVITSITMVYRGALLSSHKAEQVVRFSGMVDPISEQVRSQVQSATGQQEIQGRGKMGEIEYEWQAKVMQYTTAPEQFNIETGEIEAGEITFYLWNVKMQLQLNSTQRQYQLTELSW